MGRATKSQGDLDADRIVQVAVRLIRRKGAQKLTMRALAAELGVSPMALYHHIPGKAALLERIRHSDAALGPSRQGACHASDPLDVPPALSEERIVQEGLAMVQEQGADGLTMRGLARRLGTAPMALYNHVSSREDLIDRLRDAVFATIELPQPSADRWRQQMRDYTIQAVAALADHPGLLRAHGARRPTPGERRLSAYGISVLLEAGFEPQEAALALTAYHAQVFGFAVVADQNGGRRRTRSRRPKAARSPAAATRATVQHLLELDLQTALEYAIDTLLDGLQLRLEQGTSERAARRGARAPGRKRA